MTKRIIAFICVLALLLGTPIASVEAAAASENYRVGFGKVDVTPTIDESYLGFAMGGYGDQSSRRATRILTPQLLKSDLANGNTNLNASKAKTLAAKIPDDANPDLYHLYASCIAITDKADTTVLLMTLDVISVSSTYSKMMRDAVSEATGVPEENITITQTHTHSAPTISSSDYQQINDWRETVVTEGFVAAALAAMASRSEATMYEGSVTATNTASVRHYYTTTASQPQMLDDEGKRHVEGSNFGSIYGSGQQSVKAADEEMHLLMFKMKDTTQKDIVLCNYRVHPCRDSSSSMFDKDDHAGYTSISSDYIGPMRNALEQAGYNFAYFQGSAGNIATAKDTSLGTALDSYNYGTKLANYALQGLASNMTKVSAGPIQTQRVNMSATSYKPDPADIQPAKNVKALYTDLQDNAAIDDPELLEIFNNATYVKKTIENGAVKETVMTPSQFTSYQNYLADGKVTSAEAHNVANWLAWSYGLGSRYHANNIVSNINAKETKTLQLNAITLGENIAIVTDPNEIFDDLTQELANYYGKRTFVFGYTNGAGGYLPNSDAFHYNAKLREDGTMAYGGSYETHVTDFAMGTGEKVATTMKNMLDSMKSPEFCPCVGTHTDESACKEIVWEPWTSSTSLPTSGNYYLTKNVTVSDSTELQGTLNLDLKGMTVEGKNGIYTMAKGDHLVITDSYAGGSLGTSGIPILANAGSKLTVYAGTIGGTIKDTGASVELWGTPTLNINMAKDSPAMDCRGLQTGAYVYVVGTVDQCFANVSSADQKSCFTLQNDYSSRYENGSLYLTSKQYHCVCAGSLSGQDTDHVCEQVSWQPWNKTDSLPTTTGNYYLTSTVYLSSEQVIEEGATVRLDLNGKTVYASEAPDANGDLVAITGGTRVYYIPNGSTLEITSSTNSGSGTISTLYNSKPLNEDGTDSRDGNGGTIYADTGSTLRLYRGTLRGSEKGASPYVKYGGCVFSKGEFTMYGGTIQDGRCSSGGGCVYTGGSFAMYGGKITSGIGSGINLYIGSSGQATIGGSAYINSGIVVHKTGSLTLTGAPHIPAYTYTEGGVEKYVSGINVNSPAVIDATGLDVTAMAQTAPNGNATHTIDIKAGTSAFAKVSSSAQAAFFETQVDGYGVHCDADGNVSLYNYATDSRYGCVCGSKLTDSENHTCSVLSWQPWTSSDSLPASGNYYLVGNVDIAACTEVEGELNLDLNGYTVSATGSQRVFDVGDGETLRITDFRSGGAIDASAVSFSYELTYENQDNTDWFGGVIRMTRGTFELYGGTLTGGSNVLRGGVVYAGGTSTSKTATINMYGGTITGSAVNFGGGLHLKYAKFYMYGGTITDCSAGRGGSIYLSSYGGYADIYGGTIQNGTAQPYDYIEQDSTTKEYALTSKNAVGGNIYNTNRFYLYGGTITGGKATGSNGNGGNLGACSAYNNIRGGIISDGYATNMGSNIYVSSSLYVYGGEICDPIGERNISLWSGSNAYLYGGKIYGGAYGIYNGSSGGDTYLYENAYVSGTSYGIYINNYYTLDDITNTYSPNGKTHATVTVDKSFVGKADVYWNSDSFKALGIADGNEINHTTSKDYTGTGTLTCANLNAPLVGVNGKLAVATVAIADGDSMLSYHPDLAHAMEAYELDKTSDDQRYIQLMADLTDVAVTEDILLDLNGHDISVASVAEGCSIYGMDSKTNQYTRYGVDSADLCGALTLAQGIDPACIVRDTQVSLTKGSVHGTRKYLALTENGAYAFHRYYLSLNEVGLRPADAGIFYNAVFYGDEAVANAVTKYGVQVSTTSAFEAGSTASSDYMSGGEFQSGAKGNKGYRTVLKGILSVNGATPVVDYSAENIYGRAYIEAGGVTLYCSNTGAANLQSIIQDADTAYGKNALSTAQKDALDTMYNKYSKLMESWNILRNIGRIEIDISDLFARDPKKDDELNILLIGNSFSFYWVEELYGLLAEGSGYDPEKINITNVYYSGCPLKNHWNWLEAGESHYNIAVTTHSGRSYDKSVFYDLSAVVTGDLAKSWDFISLQQNSGAYYAGDYMGDLDYARKTLEPYLGNLLSYLRKTHPKAEYMWHQFWSHEVGHMNTDKTKVIVNNVEERTAFHDAMVAIGNEVSQMYNMTVVPTGEAWELVRDDSRIKIADNSLDSGYRTLCTRSYSSGNLYDDLYHDGDVGGGQYLNACVWYEMITGKSVLDTTWTPTYEFSGKNYDLTDAQVALLKYAAHAAVAKYTPHDDPSQDNETNILLIGNNSSYWWTDELAGMLTAAGYPNVSIYNIYENSVDLEAFWTGYQTAATTNDGNDFEFRLNNSTKEDGLTLFECITRKNWDIISLQQSSSGVDASADSLDNFIANADPYVKNLLSTLRGMFPKAEFCWMQNWAYEVYEKSTHSGDTGISTIAERQKVAGIFRDSANTMCEKYSLTKVPCGDAWELVRDNSLVNFGAYDLTTRARPTATLLTDGKLDGDYCGGQYLNACVWFEVITGTSCLDNTFVPSYNNSGTNSNLKTAQIELIQQGAHDAVAAVYGADFAK